MGERAVPVEDRWQAQPVESHAPQLQGLVRRAQHRLLPRREFTTNLFYTR